MNEEYVSQWIDLFFEQALNTGEHTNISAEPTITAILNNNKKLLDKQIDRTTIANIIELCKVQKKNERFLNLLSSLCQCQDDAVVNNQNNIVELLFEDAEAHQQFSIPIREINGVYQIFIDSDGDGSSEWVNLLDLENHSKQFDGGRLYKYFLAFLDLASALCFERNYKGVNCLEGDFPLEITFGCAKHDGLPPRMRSRFTKLLLNLHVDKDPIEPMSIPSLTRMWEDTP